MAQGGATGPAIGTRVVVDPGVVTGEDEWTRRGEDSLSPHYHILGEEAWGGCAEYVTVPAANLLPIPDGFDFPQAAAPALVFLTAWRMLVKRAQVKAGETVAIVGVGGGVNSAAIQICKHLGATVYAITSTPDKMRQGARAWRRPRDQLQNGGLVEGRVPGDGQTRRGRGRG